MMNECNFKLDNPVILRSNKDLVFDQYTKKTYHTALRYINHVHRFMNVQLKENICQYGDAKNDNDELFEFPAIPNYSLVFLKLLNEKQGEKYNGNRIDSRSEDNNQRYPLEEQTLDGIILEYDQLYQNHSSTRDLIKKEIMSEKSYCNIAHENFYENNDEKDYCLIETKHITDFDNTFKNEEVKCCKDTCSQDNKSIDINTEIEQVMEKLIGKLNTYGILNLPKNTKKQISKSSFAIVNIEPNENKLDYKAHPKDLLRQGIDFKETEKLNLSNSNHFIRPTTPMKVKDMFENISQTRPVSKKFSNELILPKNPSGSDSDSDILDDKEFEQKMRSPKHTFNKRKYMEHKKKDCKKNIKTDTLLMQPNPFKLTTKDMSKINEKILNTIGIFKENGEIRPSILNLLEEQRRKGTKDGRNKMFRDKRKWDIRIHLGPKDCYSDSVESASSLNAFNELLVMDNETDTFE